MSTMRLVGGIIAVPLFVSGCSGSKPSYWSSQVWVQEPLRIERNGEALPVNKENCLEVFGPPTFTNQIPDGEVCIWRDAMRGPPPGCKGHWDVFITFDSDGNFMPADPKADYGFCFCQRCRCDLRTIDGDRCPECGMAIERKAAG